MFAATISGSRVVLALALAWASFTSLSQLSAQQPAVEPQTGSDGFEVLDQGPVHEAFATNIGFDPTPGVTVAQQPPEAIEELPPEAKPEGNHVIWIPGYWNWDEQRSDFVWVSGIWRVVPPGQSWAPGYWEAVEGGYQWISGYWVRGEAQTVYLPAPPQSVEEGPSSPQPSENHFWIPGCWIYRDANYAWRPGFWSPVQPNWVWVPSYYDRTPYGYAYRSGYWDYPLERRGLLFAPVYFHRNAYTRSGFYYRPNHLIDTGLLLANLFANGGRRNYYYGNYGSKAYHDHGYRPWYEQKHRRDAYSPLATHYQWHHRHDRDDWKNKLAQQYQQQRTDSDKRREGDLKRQDGKDKSSDPRRDNNFNRDNDHRHDKDRIVRSFDDVRREKPSQFQRVTEQQRDKIRQNVTDYRHLQSRFSDASKSVKKSPDQNGRPEAKTKENGSSSPRHELRHEVAKPVVRFGAPERTDSIRRSDDSDRRSATSRYFDAKKSTETTQRFDTSKSKAPAKSKDTSASKDRSGRDSARRDSVPWARDFKSQPPTSRFERSDSGKDNSKQRTFVPQEFKSKSSASEQKSSRSYQYDASRSKDRGSSQSSRSNSYRNQSSQSQPKQSKSSDSGSRSKSSSSGKGKKN